VLSRAEMKFLNSYNKKRYEKKDQQTTS